MENGGSGMRDAGSYWRQKTNREKIKKRDQWKRREAIEKDTKKGYK